LEEMAQKHGFLFESFVVMSTHIERFKNFPQLTGSGGKQENV
jgi:hypothetical protein